MAFLCHTMHKSKFVRSHWVVVATPPARTIARRKTSTKWQQEKCDHLPFKISKQTHILNTSKQSQNACCIPTPTMPMGDHGICRLGDSANNDKKFTDSLYNGDVELFAHFFLSFSISFRYFFLLSLLIALFNILWYNLLRRHSGKKLNALLFTAILQSNLFVFDFRINMSC